MDRPVTRTFFRGSEGERRFVEVTWIGLQVEVVTGKVGASGRAQPRGFASVVERDAFLAKRVAKALQEGYVEGNPGERPEPDPPDPDAARAEALRRKHARTAYLPRIEEGDDAPASSKLGGTPWLPGGSLWPVCGSCDQPLRFVLQLARDDAPEAARWAFREDLIQLFLCDGSGKVGNPDWLCQADGRGWEPFAPSTVVRHVRRGAGPADLRTALPVALLELRRRCALEGMLADCRRTGREAAAAMFARRIEEERVEASEYEVPAARVETLTGQSFLLPASRIAGWTSVPDVPAHRDLRPAEVDLLKDQLGLTCQRGDKLGGFPRWAQEPAVPACRGCGASMSYLFQLTSNGLATMSVGGDGLGWIFVCAKCGEATFVWQR